MKTLTYVITLANKNLQTFANLMDNLKKIKNNNVSFVLIYRDDDEIYGELIRDNYNFFYLIKEIESVHCKKICKISKILPEINSKYVRFLDPDDLIVEDNLEDLIIELDSIDEDVVWNDALLTFGGLNKSVYSWPLTNATTIFRVDSLKSSAVDDYKYDSLFSEDIYRMLSFGYSFKMANGSFPSIKRISCPDIFYNINNESVSTEYNYRFNDSESAPNYRSDEWFKLIDIIEGVLPYIDYENYLDLLLEKDEFSKKMILCLKHLTSFLLFREIPIEKIKLSPKAKQIIDVYINELELDKKSPLLQNGELNRLDRLTLLITLYKPTEKELKFWTKFYINNFYKVKIHFLIDNPEFILETPVKVCDVFVNQKNIGKFKTVYNHIKSGNVKTTHFKVVDPDDGISFKHMNRTNFDLYEDDDVILFQVTRGKDKDFVSENDVAKLIDQSTKKTWVSSFGNSWTILPTNPIYIDKFYSGKKIFASDDQLLGFIAIANGAKVRKSSKPFYWYVEGNGNTNTSNLKRYFENCIDTFKEIQNVITLSNMPKYSNWPHDYAWFENKMLNSKNEIELKGTLNEMKKIDIYHNLKNNIKSNLLSIVFCSYRTQDEDVEYLNFIRGKLPDNVQLIYAYDNKLRDENISKLNNKIDIFESEVNSGKLKLLLNTSKIVKSKWFKVIDYDDSLNYYEIYNLISKLEEIDDDTYPSHKAAKLNSESKYYGKKLYGYELIHGALAEAYDVNWRITPNAKAFYNKEVCLKLNELSDKLTRQQYYDDDLLTLAHQGFFSRNLEIQSEIYIQNHGFGQTSKETAEDRKCSLEVVDNLLVVDEVYGLNSNNFSCDSSFLFNLVNKRAFSEPGHSGFEEERRVLRVKLDKLYKKII